MFQGVIFSLPLPCSSVPAPPFVSSMITELVKDPMQQCQAVSAWLVLVVGTALPLAMLCALERRTRRHWLARQQQQQQQQQSGGNADGLALSAAAAQAAGQPGAGATDKPLDSMQGCLPLQLYLVSCIVWLGACSLLGRGLPL